MRNQYEVRGDVTAIKLNGERECLIDTEDLEKVKAFPYTWFTWWNPVTESYYVRGNMMIDNNKQRTVHLHRWIMDTPIHLFVDHINHDTLDNRKINLRNVNRSQNGQNKKGARKDNTTGIRGLTWKARLNKWQVAIRLNGKLNYLGVYDDIEEAERVAIEWRQKYMPYSQDAMKVAE